MDEDRQRQINGLRQPMRRRIPVPGTGPLSGKLGCIAAFLAFFLLLAAVYLIFFWGRAVPL